MPPPQSTGIAREIISMPDADAATRKIRDLCGLELQYMVQHGTFPKNCPSPSGSLLWSLLQSMKHFLYADTQCIEGLNSMIKIIGKRSPNISLELLSSRLTIKRALRLHQRTTSALKFSTFRPHAEELIADIMRFKVSCLAVLGDAQRWGHATPINLQLDDNQPDQVPKNVCQGPEAIPADVDVDPMKDCETEGASSAASAAPVLAAYGSVMNHGNAQVLQSADQGARPSASSSELAVRGDVNADKHTTSAKVKIPLMLWSKSYNLGYKWMTGGGKKRKPLKTKRPPKISHEGPGLALVRSHPSFSGSSRPKHIEDHLEPQYYIVTDKFGHSVAFTELRPSGQSLIWDPEYAWVRGNTAVESTTMMSRFYDHCVLNNGVVDIRSTFLSAEQSLVLLSKGASLSLDEIHASMVDILQMTSSCMKGVQVQTQVSKPKKSKNTADDDGAVAAPATVDIDKDQEDQDDDHNAAAAAELAAELRFLHAADLGASDGESDVNDDDTADVDASGDLDVATIASFVSKSKHQSTTDMTAVRTELERMTVDDKGTCIPTAELEEEALLLVIRQLNSESTGNGSGTSSGLQFEGVGVGPSGPHLHRLNPPHSQVSDVSSDDDDINQPRPEPRLTFGAGPSTSTSSSASNPQPLDRWKQGLADTLNAFVFMRTHQDKQLGHHRSISLVLMKSRTVVTGCKCVRCQWGSDIDADLIWVTWLRNSTSHGLFGRFARQVDLDENNKVLFSVPDTTMLRTGMSRGYGHPELTCDDKHCCIIMPYVGAAMRSVKNEYRQRYGAI